jgi:hypothetical protein
MSLAKFFAFERMFDRSATFILLALGAVMAGATSLVGA